MPNYVSMLLHELAEYGLCDRHPELATYVMLAQLGQLSQSTAKAVLIHIQELIEHYKDFPCRLHRPPTEEQLYVHGKPDIRVAKLVEGEQLPYYLKVKKPLHLLATGATGGGKTTLFRGMMLAVEDLNNEREQQTNQPDRD